MTSAFQWPEGKRAALSLTFDDARLSQADVAIPALDKHGLQATFYVSLHAMGQRLDIWRRAAAAGHEIGNHTMTHPCSGNFRFTRNNALEEFSLARMENELTEANDAIERAVGVRPVTFAYPCGQKFVGRGEQVSSYVPLVARHFLAGRGFKDELGNDPSFCDLAQIYGVDGDSQTFDQLKPWIETSIREGRWLVFVSHEVGNLGYQTLPAQTLEELCRYASDPAHGLWMDTVAAIAGHIRKTRKTCDSPS